MQLKISGRLGNQMFQYATVEAFKLKNKIDGNIKISFELNEKYKQNGGFENQLVNFNINDYEVINKIKLNIIQKIVFSLYRVDRKITNRIKKSDYYSSNINLQKKWQRLLNFFGIYHYLYGYYDFKNSNFIKSSVFEGYFESYKYFNLFDNEIKDRFTPIHKELKHNRKLYEQIRNTDSVCVTIRRGDFLNDRNKKRFYICTPEYFEKGIELMNKLVKNPQYIVFSDDVEWCKNNMNFPNGTLFERGDDPVWEKLRLMYSCKNFIISNSTFSWWAQYLSRNENKIVIAPKKWSNEGEYWKDLYDSKWILL